MIKFRLMTGGINFIEDRDLDTLKEIRVTANKSPDEWPIIQLDMVFFVANDPQARVLQEWDEAQALCEQLQGEVFYVDSSQAPSVSQPGGLND